MSVSLTRYARAFRACNVPECALHRSSLWQ
ncbi:hypothetical protein [Sphingorhabdus sp. EL138]